ncbi:hypothetical protein IMSAG049_00417 [Clostridiales bacterium]|nr:hypothetical protein IMSAG049_00417 [Clostridiales bacterium]
MMASNLMDVGATGKYYKVQPNGKAQSGLMEGDRVVTNGGTYQILNVNADGSYRSALYDENITTKNYSGKYENTGPYSQVSSVSRETQQAINDIYKNGYKSSVSREKYDEVSSRKPREYESEYKRQINDILNKINSREPFSYDLSADALYQQYKEGYMSAGRRAMEDVSGQAAALTGGYGNTYAETASSAAYDRYLQQLNERIPELYERSRAAYDNEGNELYKLYSMYMNAEKADYEKYRDELADWQRERDYAYEEYKDESDRAREDYYDRLSLLKDAAKNESSDYWNYKDLENVKWNQDFQKERFDYEKAQDLAKATKAKASSSSASKGKEVTAALYDSGLEAYESGGDRGLKMFGEKLYGSGYNSSGINDIMNYAKKYGKKKTSSKTQGANGFNSTLLDLFNYWG